MRYEAMNAVLLNEVLKAQPVITEVKSVIAKQQEQITALACQIQKVTNRLELSEGARIVASDP